jgi:hypothetical protein
MLSVIMLSVIMLSVIMLSVIMLSMIMLKVVALLTQLTQRLVGLMKEMRHCLKHHFLRFAAQNNKACTIKLFSPVIIYVPQ